MSKNTHYVLEIAGELTDFVRSTKATVVTEATRVNRETRQAVRVLTGTGHESFALKERKVRIITFHTKAFTKTITLPDEIAALMPGAYVAAYERPRNDAVVGRDMEALADERYVVVQRSTGATIAYAATTREAGQVMKGMRGAQVVA